ncbi:MAG: NADH-quinone oxidoreductase subunit NuoF [Acidobacteriota bacterium]|nr:NADH-quinone oxidoreductase subunit NuoF [Acidobacteriota bacterium]
MDERAVTRFWESENLAGIGVYLAGGGYQAARKALHHMEPAAVLGEVRKAQLRGRGGAGFPAGVKWGFVPASVDKPKYLCVNADEGEPGTFKDRAIMSRNPHLLIEGIILASFAVGVHSSYIYIRGEYEALAGRLETAVREAYEAGFLGGRVFGTDFDLDVTVHLGAGAYICGEETALLESLEGKPGLPRLKPPFPATVGLFGCPTVINNVETLANIPWIIRNGADWFLRQGLPGDGGTRLFSVSGMVRKPGVYELPLGTSLRTLIYDHAGGLPEGKKLKAVIPGGLSSPILTAGEIDVRMDFDSLAEAGSMLGSAAVIVIDDRTPIFEVLKATAGFFAHESCGQCTPCRLGTSWIRKIVQRMSEGERRGRDLEMIESAARAMRGKTLCPMGDAAALPILAIISKFKGELAEGLTPSPAR